MADFAYTTVPGKIKPLLEKIRVTGVPSKVTSIWLKSVGFTSSNDTSLTGILKFIGFIDGSGTPTARWTSYRGASHKSILGKAIREGYAELFAVYPDAQNRNPSEINAVFATSSSAGQQVISKTVATFKALTEEATFEGEAEAAPSLDAGPLHKPVVPMHNSGQPAGNVGNASLHIDIQIHISPESTAEQIDSIFSSMAKHLYGGGNK